MTFTDEDLDDIVAAYRDLSESHHVPLKLGHNEEQSVTDGEPALGWITRLQKVGKQLVADFSDVPSVIKEAIAKKLYRAVSVELLLNAKHGGKAYKYILDAVAILGADAPAVNTLPDLRAYLASRSIAELDDSGRRVVFEALASGRKFTYLGGRDTMDEEDIKKLVATSVAAAVDPLKTQIDGLSKENGELRTKLSKAEDETARVMRENKSMKDEKEEDAKEARKEAVKMARENAIKVIDEAVKSKKITPAQRDQALEIFGINDDARVIKIKLSDIRDYYSLGKETKDLGNKDTTRSGSNDELPEGRTHKSVFKEVHHRINMTRAKEPKLSYKEASRVVFSSDEELHREYLNEETPENHAAGGAA
jgi:hypothetical protein